MCELCHESPCLFNCPNAPEASPIDEHRLICAWCDEPIFDEVYYLIDGDSVCADCVEECRCDDTEREAM